MLTADESVVLHLRPHWKTAVRPVLVLVGAVVAVLGTWLLLPDNDGGRIGVAVTAAVAAVFVVTRAVWPLLVWRCTHVVLTDERILLQSGVVTRDRRDLPLSRVNDHAMRQSVGDRILGCGTLTIDSLSENGPVVVAAVPRVQRVQTALYELIEAELERTDDEADERATRSG